MKRFTGLFVFLLLLGSSFLIAQETVTGVVTSAEDGEPIPGVSVVVDGTTIGTITDIQGEYSITVPSDTASLRFSFVGLEKQTLPVAGQTQIDVVMNPTAIGVDEVVVTAMGFRRNVKSLSFSQQSVDDEDITQAGQPDLASALQGKVAGVGITSSSGNPGASNYMTIRGARFLDGNNQPLFVVDGQPIESNPIFVDAQTVDRVAGSDASSRTLDINPDDIESIDVLKGPAAAALYGLRASNGAVIITTKSGRTSRDGDVTFSTSFSMDQVTRLPSLQSTYAQGSDGSFQQNASTSWGPPIDSLDPYLSTKTGDTITPQLHDNVEPFFRDAKTYTVNLGFANGNDNGNYHASLGFMDQTGVIPATNMQRYTGKLTGRYKITDKLHVGGTAMFTHLDINKPANGSNLSNPLFTVYFAPRSYDLFGTPYAEEDNPYQQIHYRSAMDNPRWSVENNKFNEKNDRFIGNIHFEYNLLDYLSVRYQLGADYLGNQQKEVYELGSGESGGRGTTPSGGQITDFNWSQRETNSNLSFILDKKINNLGISAILGNEIYDYYAREMKTIGTGFNIGGYHNVRNTASQEVTEDIFRRRTAGIYGTTTLDYDEIVYLTLTGRNDIVSNLAEGNRSYFYPSVGMSFVFTEVVNIPEGILNFGKVRASWAEVGQSYDASYPTQNVYVQGASGSGFLSDDYIFPIDGQNAFGHYFELRSDDLQPQNTTTIELGIDLRFFRNRVHLDYTYFNAQVEDQIFAVPISPSTGYTEELRNAGSVESIGHEAILNVIPVLTSDFRWDITANFTNYTNTVLELAPGVSDIYLGGFTTPSIRALAGETYPSIFGIGYLRDEDGNIVLLDDPGNPYHGMPLSDPNSKKIGDVQPDFFVGLNNKFSYKGISLTVLVDWKQGGEMYSGNNRLGRLYGMLEITEDRESPVVLDGVKGYLDANGDLVVTGDNDIAILRNDNYWNDVLGDIDEAHVMEASYLRLREIAMSYRLPSSIIGGTFIENATISLFGRNLALWSSYPNFDPESSTTGAVNGQGLEYVAFPQTRSFGGKLNFTF
ncbi:MAG: SusC/RagA family TonB-linked outer membrane protein [Bacteroidetes bacterium]|jgi:TonB-linked SusC/RagA family outer membrane protein|nr:SusC/RagA family TonB-linked outer membrane protein [Bacteroidota bacterium]